MGGNSLYHFTWRVIGEGGKFVDLISMRVSLSWVQLEFIREPVHSGYCIFERHVLKFQTPQHMQPVLRTGNTLLSPTRTSTHGGTAGRRPQAAGSWQLAASPTIPQHRREWIGCLTRGASGKATSPTRDLRTGVKGTSQRRGAVAMSTAPKVLPYPKQVPTYNQLHLATVKGTSR